MQSSKFLNFYWLVFFFFFFFINFQYTYPWIFSSFSGSVSKIRPHCWKERHKIRKLAKFESDTTQRSEDIHVAPQVAKIHRRLCGGSKFVLCKIS